MSMQTCANLVNEQEMKRIDWEKMPENVRVMSDGYMFYHDGRGEFRVCPTWDINCATGVFAEFTLASEQPITTWFGGECPVPEGVLVKLWFRKGMVIAGEGDFPGSIFHWVHSGEGSDIIAYQVAGLAEGWAV